MAKKQEVNIPVVGMNRGGSIHNLKPQEYTFAKNVNFQNETGNTNKLTTEQSNLLASKFKDGYKVVGFKNDITTNATYFFLTNPLTGISEFGRIKDNQTLPNLSDIIEETGCTDCDKKIKLSDPLESQTQVATQVYETLLEDSCNQCLGLSIYNPIKTIIIKNEKCGNTLYFTDNSIHGFRYIQLDKLDIYSYTGDENCGIDNTTPTCLDCDKLKVFRLYNEAKITPVEIVLGGRLRRGTYEFLLAYSDNLGNELSEYFSITTPVAIFDENDNVLEQENLVDRTNFAIKLDVTGLDTTFKYYKVVVIQNTSLDGAIRYYEEGIHSTTDNTVLYATEDGKQTTTLSNIFVPRNNIVRVKGIATANNYLFGYGTEAEKEWNLQPVVNFLGSFVKWQTHMTTEDYYSKGIYEKGYMRDEVYPLSIRFSTNTGYKTALFPLISRPATTEDREVVDNLDTQSILNNQNSCNGSIRTERWNFYNTASVEGDCSLSEDIITNTITENITKTCIIEDAVIVPPGTFVIEDVEEFIDLNTLINQVLEEGACVGYPFCSYLNLDLTPDCDPNFNNCDTPILINEFFQVSGITGDGENGEEILTIIEKSFPDDYRRSIPLAFCNLYIASQSGSFERDTQAESDTGLSKVYLRNYLFTNDACSYSDELTISDSITNQNYFHNYFIGTTDISSVQTIYDSSCDISGNFSSKVHRSALWFNVELEDKDRFVFEITKQIDPSGDDSFNTDLSAWWLDFSLPEYLRLTFFDGCGNTTPLYCQTLDAKAGTIIMIDKNEDGTQISFEDVDNNITTVSLTTDNLVIAIDNAIVKSSSTGNYYTKPTDGCFGVLIKAPEIDSINVEYDSISFNKIQKYEASCDFEVPVIDECNLIPYKYGTFAYVESTEDYPDNQELYNSSTIQVNENDFYNISIASDFESLFAINKDGSGNYTLSSDTNFSCKPIRHFKFPDNKISPFMYEVPQAGFTSSIIYPLGVTIDENVINDFLDIAVNNELITQQQRDSIVSYEIFRGDRTLNKSILAKGLVYDMYEYTEDRQQVLYSNYPYNDLGSDTLNYADENRNTFVEHPYSGDSNTNFTFHSPDTDYLRPTLPTEMKVEGYMFGNSRGSFDEVEDHAKWVILGAQAKRLASTLATAEVAAEAALNIAMAYGGNNLFFVGVGATGGTFAGVVFASIAAGFQIAAALIYKYGRYKYEWIKTFRDLGQPYNFAYYYASEGYYNYLNTLQTEGQELRALNLSEYLKDERKILIDKIDGKRLEINNFRREDSVFLSIGSGFPITYPIDYKSYDNTDDNLSLASRTYLSRNLNCTSGRSPEIVKNVASPFVTLKNYIPSQYNTIDSIKWLFTSFSGDLLNPTSACLPIFGGDTYLCRHTLKRKIPLFLRDASDIASLTPFNYKFYGNIGKEPRFFCNYETPNETNIDRNFPTIESIYNFDCLENATGFYIKPPTKFYLYYYGIPNFLTESTINTNFRYGKKQPENNFYPNVGDYMEWTQQNLVPIKSRNTFFYNFNYSKEITRSILRTLPATYSKAEFDCRFDEENGVFYSLPDNSENDLYDPWLIFRPLDKYSFSSSYGKLIDIRGIENEQVLARFTDSTVIFNAVDQTQDDGSRPETQDLGNGAIFARRPRTFSNTDLGKWGTQSFDMSSNEFGHFSVDAKRGSITRVYPSSQGVKEISKYGGANRPNGMFNWFKEHLPFKILNSQITNYESIDIDNPYNGVGITIGYDDRYKRIFFTKKDYVPKTAMYYEDGKFYLVLNDLEVSLTNSQYFDDVSWTIAYDPIEESWISYYDFKPNYYISHNNYFQTGLNTTDSTFGLWSHNLTNKSYRVFYGQKYPSAVEFVTKNDLTSVNLNNIMFKSDAKRYHSDYDIAYDRNITWNKAMVYSTRENSGELILVPQVSLSQVSKYPKTNSNNTQDILVSNTNELWSFDYIYNRVLSEKNNQPHLIFDKNYIERSVNPDVVKFYGKKILENLSSTAFNVYLEYTGDTRYEVDLQWTINQEENA